MSDVPSTAPLRAARDLLLDHRTDYAAAAAGFRWPELDEFNWALDWFDVISAEHPDRIALRVVGDDGSDEAVSYGAMSARSAQVANWLRGRAVQPSLRCAGRRGPVDPVLRGGIGTGRFHPGRRHPRQ